MITLAEIHAGIYGAWRLARRDPQGMSWFNDSPQGYWRSYWAAVVAFPSVMFLEALSGGFGDDPGLRQVIVKLIAYVLDWVSFPLLMIAITDSMGKFPRYWRYIAAYNWSAVVQIAVLLPLAVLAAVFPNSPAPLIALSMTVLLLVYRAYIAHIALGVGVGAAIGITILDILLAVLLDVIAGRIMIAGPA